MLEDPDTPTLSFGEDEEYQEDQPEVGVDLMDSGGDACCINSKNLWEEAIIETFPPGWDDPADYNLIDPETGQPDESPLRDQAALQSIRLYNQILEKYRNMSCDQFREELERRAAGVPDLDGLDGSLAIAAHKVLRAWDDCVQESMFGSKVTEDNDGMFLSDRQDDNPFDVAWALMKMSDGTRDALEEFDRNVGGKLNWVSLYAGLGESPLSENEPLGLAGYGTAAKRRGHNVHSFDWGMDSSDPPRDAELPQGDLNYHIDDIMSGSVKDKVEELLELFDGGPIDFLSAGVPCKAFSIGGQNVAWKVNEDTIRHYWKELKGDKPFLAPTPKQLEDDPGLTPEMKAWGLGGPNAFNRKGEPTSIKALLMSQRQKEGMGKRWGRQTFEPKTVDEIMFDAEGEPRIYQGKEITEESAQSMRDKTLHGEAMLNRTGDIIDMLYDQGQLGHHMIENPRAKMRYHERLSHMPVHETTGASYRNPAASGIFGLPRIAGEFDMGKYANMRARERNKPTFSTLPPQKATDLIANLPSTFQVRPFLGKGGINQWNGQDVAGNYYLHGPRGSMTGIQGMPGLKANRLFPGSPPIDAFHVRSLAPFQMGNDITHALEQHHGIHPGDQDPNEVIRRFMRKRSPTTLDQF